MLNYLLSSISLASTYSSTLLPLHLPDYLKSLWTYLHHTHRDHMRRVLNLPNFIAIEYKKHEDSLADKSSYRNPSVVWRAPATTGRTQGQQGEWCAEWCVKWLICLVGSWKWEGSHVCVSVCVCEFVCVCAYVCAGIIVSTTFGFICRLRVHRHAHLLTHSLLDIDRHTHIHTTQHITTHT